MTRSLLQLACMAGAFLPLASAGFDAASHSNIAVYWGQNSAGGANTQGSLASYCANTPVNIIPLAFMDLINGQDVNFASAGNACTAFSGSRLLNCPTIAADIQTCQQTYGKTIILSIGGATYTEGGFTSASAAATAAHNIWAMFGPATAQGVNRPFGSVVVDGFDFDFESTTSNMATFGSTLRTLMDQATDKKYYLSAAPQCVYPDAADNDMLSGAVAFDFINIQFYNNYCGVQAFVPGTATQNNFNFATWDNWAKTVSANKNVKLLLGIPASSSAAGSGYVSGSQLAGVIAYSSTFSSFGGVMMWDMSQLQANTGFLGSVASALGAAPGATSTPVTTNPAPSPTQVAEQSAPTTSQAAPVPEPTTPASDGSGSVQQWGQCGGNGYSGPTQCVAGFTCQCNSVWWCACK